MYAWAARPYRGNPTCLSITLPKSWHMPLPESPSIDTSNNLGRRPEMLNHIPSNLPLPQYWVSSIYANPQLYAVTLPPTPKYDPSPKQCQSSAESTATSVTFV